MIKFALLSLVKASVLTAIASLGLGLFALVAAAIAQLGVALPVSHAHVDGFVAGFWFATLLGSAVNSMLEPDEKSSPAYVFIFRFGHLVMSRATAYVTDRSMWGLFKKRDEAK